MNRKLVLLSQAVAAAALLAACGGGGGGDAPAPAPMPGPLDAVPPGASASVQGMVGYLDALSTQKPEDKEPVAITSFSPPTSDDTEPSAV